MTQFNSSRRSVLAGLTGVGMSLPVLGAASVASGAVPAKPLYGPAAGVAKLNANEKPVWS